MEQVFDDCYGSNYLVLFFVCTEDVPVKYDKDKTLPPAALNIECPKSQLSSPPASKSFARHGQVHD